MKISVSKRALFLRVDRALQKQGQRLRTPRNFKQKRELGEHYITDGRSVVRRKMKLESLARELGVLRADEKPE